MKARITEDCTSCGVCVETCPEVFEEGDDVTRVKVDQVPAGLEDKVREAAEGCPVEAIILED